MAESEDGSVPILERHKCEPVRQEKPLDEIVNIENLVARDSPNSFRSQHANQNRNRYLIERSHDVRDQHRRQAIENRMDVPVKTRKEVKRSLIRHGSLCECGERHQAKECQKGE